MNKISNILKAAGHIGDIYNFRVFAVGGFVRDMQLGENNLDIDIAVEGDGLKLARKLTKDLNGSLTVHKCFGTATINTYCKNTAKLQNALEQEIRIDIATARKEIYKHPADYPRVIFSTIEDDLGRRDFTINAMAVSLNRGSFGEMLDPYNGRKDLKCGIIRVLHDNSFLDDPTRIFRAIRFEQRYKFKTDSKTMLLMKSAIQSGMLDRLSGQRIIKEKRLIKKEKSALKILARLEYLTGGRHD
jgi:tRNA nucleotidyltransferase (CCA-adding enzyme)